MRDSSLQVRVKWMRGEKSSEADPVFGRGSGGDGCMRELGVGGRGSVRE